MAEIAYKALSMHTLGTCLVTGYFVLVCLFEFHHQSPAAAALGLHWSNIMVMLWPLYYYYVVAAAMAVVSARRGAVLRLWCQSGENKHTCSSYGSLRSPSRL